MVELLRPVWYLPSTLVAANCLDTLLDRDVPGTPRGGQPSGSKARSPQRVTEVHNVLECCGSCFLEDAFKLSGLNEFQLHFILFYFPKWKLGALNAIMQ